MKRCIYCGKEYGDDATACAIDAQPLRRITEEERKAEEQRQSEQQREREVATEKQALVIGAQDSKHSEAVRNIITGGVTVVVALGIGFGWESGTDWPKIILYGGLIVGIYTAYQGIRAIGR